MKPLPGYKFGLFFLLLRSCQGSSPWDCSFTNNSFCDFTLGNDNACGWIVESEILDNNVKNSYARVDPCDATIYNVTNYSSFSSFHYHRKTSHYYLLEMELDHHLFHQKQISFSYKMTGSNESILLVMVKDDFIGQSLLWEKQGWSEGNEWTSETLTFQENPTLIQFVHIPPPRKSVNIFVGIDNVEFTNSSIDIHNRTDENSQTSLPSTQPSLLPTSKPSSHPTSKPSSHPTSKPSSHPTSKPSSHPTSKPSSHPISEPSSYPTSKPSSHPTSKPSSHPPSETSSFPTSKPSSHPPSETSSFPTSKPSSHPSHSPTFVPSVEPFTPSKPVQTPVPSPLPTSRPSLHLITSTSPSLTPTSIEEDFIWDLIIARSSFEASSMNQVQTKDKKNVKRILSKHFVLSGLEMFKIENFDLTSTVTNERRLESESSLKRTHLRHGFTSTYTWNMNCDVFVNVSSLLNITEQKMESFLSIITSSQPFATEIELNTTATILNNNDDGDDVDSVAPSLSPTLIPSNMVSNDEKDAGIVNATLFGAGAIGMMVLFAATFALGQRKRGHQSKELNMQRAIIAAKGVCGTQETIDSFFLEAGLHKYTEYFKKAGIRTIEQLISNMDKIHNENDCFYDQNNIEKLGELVGMDTIMWELFRSEVVPELRFNLEQRKQSALSPRRHSGYELDELFEEEEENDSDDELDENDDDDDNFDDDEDAKDDGDEETEEDEEDLREPQDEEDDDGDDELDDEDEDDTENDELDDDEYSDVSDYDEDDLNNWRAKL